MRVFTLNQIGRHELDVIQMAVAVEHLHETEFMRGHFRPTEYTQHLAQFERVVTGGAFDASALPHTRRDRLPWNHNPTTLRDCPA